MKGKKRVEKVVLNFAELNGQIKEKIKLCSLALDRGVDLKGHLERLQTDPAAKQLGFDVNAALLAHMIHSSPGPVEDAHLSAEAFTAGLNEIIKLPEVFSLAKMNGKLVLLEERDYHADVVNPRQLDARTKGQIDALAKLLKQPREQDFRIPPCLWWTHLPDKQKIYLAFETQSGVRQSPISLNQLLSLDLRLSLSKKFQLAHSLARCLSQFQLVGWVCILPSEHAVHNASQY
jgi:hypothetical protein